MDVRITAKLFHTVVVVGMGLATVGCSSDDPTPTTGSSSGTTPTTSSTSTAANDAGQDAGHTGDTMPSWSCCA